MNILLIGCGKMGGALLTHWLSGPESFFIVDPGLEIAPDGATLVAGRDDLAGRKFDVVIAAVKPQQIDDILPQYADAYQDDGYLLSIAAGCSIERLAKASGGKPVVRVMPNLPAAIGRGMSGMCASDSATDGQKAHASAMMERTGSIIEVANEDMLDRLTAVAGSGPGYVFEMARAYVEAAIGLGFAEHEARQLVLETMGGTIAMAVEDGGPLEEMRNSVTSKNGTTQAGLGALNGSEDFTRLITATLDAAYRRAVELR
ncbi:pyrroline-5-carboxylate reductase [Altererythrobacter luteolus]|uniref:Pyrroline-5-carboxylate reductase n=1 Tax=Pontixanthobacter luteolus TaxID=295089 RepID=A0A6I4UW43_9SPHN|nr:pyrroline-5-carboxylate reductase [Pontixanthobacter luteolus]